MAVAIACRFEVSFSWPLVAILLLGITFVVFYCTVLFDEVGPAAGSLIVYSNGGGCWLITSEVDSSLL